jgi:autotransporter-associated beta strand protein
MHHRRLTRVLLPAAAALFATVPAMPSSGQVANPAFPGAEGFGAGATMRKNNAVFAGNVYHVTSLDDGVNAATTVGTLRNAVRESGFPAGGRVVVFDVGGTINLTASLDIKNVNGLYIAGQTAPSPITIVGDTSQITSSSGKVTQNVILRYLTFRKGSGNGEDAITFAGSGTGTNLILDHISSAWGEDETLSVANNNSNVSVQYSIVAESINDQDHGFGSLVRPRVDSNVSFHHDLYANNKSRNPRAGSYLNTLLTYDFRNNLVYNSLDRNGYAGGSSEAEQERVHLNYVGNYVVAGPSSVNNVDKVFLVDKNVDLNSYQSGNFIDTDKQSNPGGVPNGSDQGYGAWQQLPIAIDSNWVQEPSPIAIPAANSVVTQSAPDAFNQILNYVGNSWANRDAVDARITNDVLTNDGAVINDAAQIAAEYNALVNAPTVTRPAGFDADNDGMADAWEVAHGGTSLSPTGDFDSDGYSNIEEYVNDLGAFPAPRAIAWSGGAAGRYALNVNWDTWQPSRFDTVNIDSGKATVDAVGQHAGTLNVAQGAGSTAEVAVTGGWLDVATAVNVGSPSPGGAGTLRLTGGSITIGSALNLNASGTIILGGGILGLNGAGQFNWNGGTVQTTVDQAFNLNATLGAAGATLDTTDRIVSWSGHLGGAGGLTKLGAGTLTLAASNMHAGGVNVAAGTLVVAHADALGTGGLSVANGATARVQPGLTKAVTVAGVTTAGNGQLDLTNNSMVIRGMSLAQVQAMVQQAFNGGHWNGAGGITSSIAATNASGTTAVGVATNAVLNKTSFKGVDGLTAIDVLVKYTYYGDADLSGFTTLDDFTLFLAGYQNGGSTWLKGDFDYSGLTTLDDFTLFLKGYQQQGAPLSEIEALIDTVPMSGAERAAMLAAAQSVPEPGPLSLRAVAVARLLHRKRRRRRRRYEFSIRSSSSLAGPATVPSGCLYQPGSSYLSMSSRTLMTVNMPPMSM